MSWFSNLNVNESLNTLKGQITNVSNAMHDVLTETIVEKHESDENNLGGGGGGDDEVLIGLETANKRIDDLNALCETKDTEVSSKRQSFLTQFNGTIDFVFEDCTHFW